MKKSRIIIPALGMLLLSTAASVSGTVAWFTSMQTGTADITSFAVTKTGGNLSVVQSVGAGTALSGSAITLATDVKLTHGSYDHTADKAYYPNDIATSCTGVDRPTAAGNYTNWALPGTDNKIYFAVSWTITFTYEWGGSSNPVNLYFDGTSGTGATSSFTPQTAAGGTAAASGLATYHGFRLAMVGTKKVIWAPGTDVVADEMYQNGTAITAQGAYASSGSTSAPNTYVASGSIIDADGLAADKTSATPSTERADYIGTFTRSGTEASTNLAVTCVAWYEGNDQNVVDGAELDKVTATLGFYTRVTA